MAIKEKIAAARFAIDKQAVVIYTCIYNYRQEEHDVNSKLP
jgi:hypothetical protein